MYTLTRPWSDETTGINSHLGNCWRSWRRWSRCSTAIWYGMGAVGAAQWPAQCAHADAVSTGRGGDEATRVASWSPSTPPQPRRQPHSQLPRPVRALRRVAPRARPGGVLARGAARGVRADARRGHQREQSGMGWANAVGGKGRLIFLYSKIAFAMPIRTGSILQWPFALSIVAVGLKW